MKAVATFFFVLLSVVVSFAQVAQPYGAEPLTDIEVVVEKNGTVVLTIWETEDEMEVIFVERQGKKRTVYANEITPSPDTTKITGHNFDLDGKSNHDIYIKTPKGVTSVNILKEGKVYYAVVNGQWELALDDKWNLSDDVKKPKNFFKNKVAWQYTPQVEAD